MELSTKNKSISSGDRQTTSSTGDNVSTLIPEGCGMIFEPWSGLDRWACKSCRFETFKAEEAKRRLLAQCGPKFCFEPVDQSEVPDLEPSDLQPDSHEQEEI